MIFFIFFKEMTSLNKNSLGLSPFRMLICGPSACGKSETVLKIMSQIHRDYDFHYLICPTVHQELYQKRLKFKKDCIEEDPTDEAFNGIIEKVKKNNDKGKKSLIVCDDILYTDLTAMNSSLCKVFTRIRHYNCSIICIVQQYKKIPPVIRNNLTHSIIFDLENNNAEKVLFEEYSDKFKEKYKEYTDEKYKFIFTDFTVNEKDDTRYKATI